ncbi:hypothetical protein [Haloglomus halophilum]|uniref:hypothetical protein n=1 Tax=Haloglomus halophilum TaxID=2962672 RepID=UPI0020CA2089|nr:hypothetical protein [Haloglomus halophilum]
MVTVTYTCPRCDAVVELERDAYLADKAVTPDPLAGWTYVPVYEAFEAGTEPPLLDGDAIDADGVELVCGASETRGEGCGRPFYLSFVRHEDGEEVDPNLSLDDVSFDFLRG